MQASSAHLRACAASAVHGDRIACPRPPDKWPVADLRWSDLGSNLRRGGQWTICAEAVTLPRPNVTPPRDRRKLPAAENPQRKPDGAGLSPDTSESAMSEGLSLGYGPNGHGFAASGRSGRSHGMEASRRPFHFQRRM